jgi:hypothetical protein
MEIVVGDIFKSLLVDNTFHVFPTNTWDRSNILFKNKINYTLAARNPEENGVLRLRELAKERLGVPVGFNARIAKPGEIEAVDNRMTDEELGRIQFKVEFED